MKSFNFNVWWTWDLNVDTPEGILFAGSVFIAMVLIYIGYQVFVHYSDKKDDHK